MKYNSNFFGSLAIASFILGILILVGMFWPMIDSNSFSNFMLKFFVSEDEISYWGAQGAAAMSFLLWFLFCFIGALIFSIGLPYNLAEHANHLYQQENSGGMK